MHLRTRLALSILTAAILCAHLPAQTTAQTAPAITLAAPAATPAVATTADLAVTITVAGTPAPTGYVTLSEPGYALDPVALSAGSATVTIPAGMTSGNLTISYAPDTASAATYTASSSSIAVAVAATPAAAVIVPPPPAGPPADPCAMPGPNQFNVNPVIPAIPVTCPQLANEVAIASDGATITNLRNGTPVIVQYCVPTACNPPIMWVWSSSLRSSVLIGPTTPAFGGPPVAGGTAAGTLYVVEAAQPISVYFSSAAGVAQPTLLVPVSPPVSGPAATPSTGRI